MLCCMIAALIMAHITAAVRRWLVFLGLARPQQGEASHTVFTRLRDWLRRPMAKRLVASALAVELIAGGSWVGVAHGAHLYRLGDQALGALNGERVHYVGVCDKTGKDRMMRVAIDRGGTVSVRQI